VNAVTSLSAIVATGLRRSFGEKVVLGGIDLDVPEGSITYAGLKGMGADLSNVTVE
jgi:ABC-type transporter Mla maintaining outer membrane lipid asymmetry ATPase subunit MlaF